MCFLIARKWHLFRYYSQVQVLFFIFFTSIFEENCKHTFKTIKHTPFPQGYWGDNIFERCNLVKFHNFIIFHRLGLMFSLMQRVVHFSNVVCVCFSFLYCVTGCYSLLSSWCLAI